jgi:signal transduction histidine kinase
MPQQRLILALPRSLRQWGWLLLVIIGVSLLAKTSIYVVGVSTGTNVISIPVWQGLLISLLYSTTIIILQLSTAELAEFILPLRSKRAVTVHILIQSCSAVVGFLLSRELEIAFMGQCLMPASGMYIVMAVSFVLALIGNAGYYLYSFYSSLRIAEQLVVESEIKALRAQINPHFLFNTLNSISALIRIRPDEAEFVTQQLADLFRYSLRSSKQPLVTLADELSAVEMYLSIEKARFGERLQIDIQVPSDLHTVALPSMILQPLVENAVKHGLHSTDDVHFTIRVYAHRMHNHLTIRIEDTGKGFDLSWGEDIFFTKGTGLANVRERLQLLYPRDSAVHIEHHAVMIACPCHILAPDNRLPSELLFEKQ